VVLADIMESMCSDWLTGQLKDPKTKQKEIKLGKQWLFPDNCSDWKWSTSRESILLP